VRGWLNGLIGGFFILVIKKGRSIEKKKGKKRRSSNEFVEGNSAVKTVGQEKKRGIMRKSKGIGGGL